MRSRSVGSHRALHRDATNKFGGNRVLSEELNEMDQEEARLQWLTALMSGEFKQTKQRLRRGDSFCCLGVACEVYRECTGKGKWRDDAFELGFPSHTSYLPFEIREWLDLGKGDCDSAMEMNDKLGYSFTEIARIFS